MDYYEPLIQDLQLKNIQKQNFNLINQADKKEHFNDWYFKYLPPIASNSEQEPQTKGNDADKRLKYCLKCNRIWETTTSFSTTVYNRKINRRRNILLFYFEEGVKLGKPRETCPICKGRKVNQVNNW